MTQRDLKLFFAVLLFLMDELRAGLRRDMTALLDEGEPVQGLVQPVELAILVLMVFGFVMIIVVVLCWRQEEKPMDAAPVAIRRLNNIEYV